MLSATISKNIIDDTDYPIKLTLNNLVNYDDNDFNNILEINSNFDNILPEKVDIEEVNIEEATTIQKHENDQVKIDYSPVDDFVNIKMTIYKTTHIENDEIDYICNNKEGTDLEYSTTTTLDYDKELLSFNWKQYINNYKDLRHSINSKEKAWQHWNFYGRHEGRSYLPLNDNSPNKTKNVSESSSKKIHNILDETKFDWRQYIKNYKDLQNSINSKEEAWRHWINHGKSEDRTFLNLHECPSDFHWKKYILHYTDLTKNNINTPKIAWEHWLKHGQYEGRQYFKLNTNSENRFDWKQYLYNYEDLTESGISDKKGAWDHWISHGKKEGRVFQNIYEEEYKEYNNFDLININNLYFKEKYDKYGVHYFGWKGVIEQFIKWFKTNKSQEYICKLFFDEWIEKLLIWGNKMINHEYLKHISSNKYKMISFIHCPPFVEWNNLELRKKITAEMIISDNSQFNENLFNKIHTKNITEKILFLYTLSNTHKKYLYETYPAFKDKIVSVYHPIDLQTNAQTYFSMNKFLQNKKIYNIGWWLRNFKTFIDFTPSPCFTKSILIKSDFSKTFENTISKNYDLSGINIVNELTDQEYMKLFENCCIFADIVDCVANNTILECIKFNTPIILRRTPCAEEYLGTEYPLFFNDINELNLLEEETFLLDLIIKSHTYLEKMDKTHVSLERFNTKIQYDLNKLKTIKDTNKLSWFCFVSNDEHSYIDSFIKTFVSQINYHELQLFIFIDHNENITIFNNLLKRFTKYENIKLVSLCTTNNKLSFAIKLHAALPFMSTIYVTILDIKISYDIHYSNKFIHYLDNNVNCDALCSSINILDKHFKPNTCIFVEDIHNVSIEYNGIVWRTDMIRLIHNNYNLEKIDKLHFFNLCNRNHYNIFYM